MAQGTPRASRARESADVTNYREIKSDSEKDVNAFASKFMFFAFDDKQFAEGMAKLGLDPGDTHRIRNLGGGSFIRADKVGDFQRILNEQNDRIRKASKSESFAFEMFCTELANHEYAITLDPMPAIQATGYTMAEVANNPTLSKALKDAENYVLQNSSWNRKGKACSANGKGRDTPWNVQSDPGWNQVGKSAYVAPGGWKVEKVGSVWNLWGPNGFSGSYPTLTEAGRYVCLVKGSSPDKTTRKTGKGAANNRKKMPHRR